MAQAGSPSLHDAVLHTPQLQLVILQMFAQLQHDRDFAKSENQMYKFHLSRAEDRLRKEQMRRMTTEHQMNEQVGVFQAKSQAALETATEVQRLLKKAEQELATAVEEAKKFKELSAKKDNLLLKLKNELKVLKQKVNLTMKDTKVIQDMNKVRSMNLKPTIEQSREIEAKLGKSVEKGNNFQRLAEEREQQLRTADGKIEVTEKQLQSAKEEIKELQAALLNASQNAASCEAKYQMSVEEALNLKNSMKADKELLIQTWVTGNATVANLKLALEAEKDKTQEKGGKEAVQMAEERARQNEKEAKLLQEQQKLLQELETERNRSLSLQLALDQNVFSGFANISALITTFGDNQEKCQKEKQQLEDQLVEQKRKCESRNSDMQQNILTVLQELKNITNANRQTSEEIKVSLLADLDSERSLRSSIQLSFTSSIPDQLNSLMEALTLHHKNVTESLETYIIRPKENRRKLPYVLHGRTMLEVLLTAASIGNITELEILLDSGADIESHDDNYMETPLIWSAENGRVDACRFLLERGANIHARATGWGNRTALHVAALNNRIGVIQLLAELGADVNATDADGKTPSEVGDDDTKAWFTNFLSGSEP